MTSEERQIQRLLQAIEAEMKRLDPMMKVEPLAALPPAREVLRLPPTGAPDGDAAPKIEELYGGEVLIASIPQLGMRIVLGGRGVGSNTRYHLPKNGHDAAAASSAAKSAATSPAPPPAWLTELGEMVLRFLRKLRGIPSRTAAQQMVPLIAWPAAPNDKAALANAVSVLNNPEFKARACSALKSVSDDLRDVYKPLVRYLLPLSATSTVSAAAAGTAPLTLTIAGVSLSAVTLAVLAIIISRAGIATLCGTSERRRSDATDEKD